MRGLQEKRRRQAEIENRRRQLEDDRRQLQHLKVRAEPRLGVGRLGWGGGRGAASRDPCLSRIQDLGAGSRRVEMTPILIPVPTQTLT